MWNSRSDPGAAADSGAEAEEAAADTAACTEAENAISVHSGAVDPGAEEADVEAGEIHGTKEAGGGEGKTLFSSFFINAFYSQQ